MFELLPLVTFKVQYFMLSLETQRCVQNSTHFSVIQHHLKGCSGFTTGGRFYTVYLL